MLDLTGYKLTFDEEFNNLSVSQSGGGTTWADIRETSRLNANADIGFGNSAFVDAASGINPFKVSGGVLTITAVQADKALVGFPDTWASGLIHSNGSFNQLYGYFEMRAQLPTDKGVWPAFWMLRSDHSWPPELDIVEAYGDKNLWQYVHTGKSDNQVQVWSEHASMLSGYHTYGVNWQSDYITFYFDGQVTGRTATPADMHSPMYMLVDLAIKNSDGPNAAPKHMQVDYVRAYSADPNAAAVALDTVSSPDGVDTSGLYGAIKAGPAAGPAPTPVIPGPKPGATGALTLDGTDKSEVLTGGALGDFVRGFSGADTIFGQAGDDDLNGNEGADRVFGGAGADIVRGGKDNDTVSGDDGDDVHVNGNIGDDSVSGGDGADTLYGGQGSDSVYGDGGDDLLSGDRGADILFGGAGADRFMIAAGGGVDWIRDFNPAEGDRIQLAAGTKYELELYQGHMMLEIPGVDAALGLTGVSTFSADWVVFA